MLSGAGRRRAVRTPPLGRAAAVLGRWVRPRRSDVLVVGAAISPRPFRHGSTTAASHRAQVVDAGRPAGTAPPGPPWWGRTRCATTPTLEWWSRSRYLNHGQHSFELLARDHDVQFLAPYSEDLVMRALAADRRGVGFPSRAAALAHVFCDLLPSEIMARRSKATFLSPLVARRRGRSAGPPTPRRCDAGVGEPGAVATSVAEGGGGRAQPSRPPALLAGRARPPGPVTPGGRWYSLPMQRWAARGAGAGRRKPSPPATS